MAPKSLAEQMADLEDPTPKDFDPEDLDYGAQGSDEESLPEKDESAGREHYQAVGKGKLRKQDPINLGKQYAGSRVSRDALEVESDDDPFRAPSSDEGEDGFELEDDEVESDGVSDGESEEDRPKQPKSAKKAKQQQKENADESDSMGSDVSDDIDGEEDSEEGLDDDDEDEEMGSDMSDDEDDESDRAKPSKVSKSDDREELRRLMATDQKTIAATISQAAKADALKGKAVKQQRSTFDALLNTRIKLQKGLTAVNQLSAAAKDADDVDGKAVQSAESAALTLWSTLEDLRVALADAQSTDGSNKRKRPSPVSPATSSASLWKRMTDLESESSSHRSAILNKWSLKVRGSNATIPNARGKLLGSGSGSQQTITSVIDAQIASETGERTAKRARSQSNDDEPVYDDTIFYQSLLRELVEQRMASSDAITNGLDTMHLQNLPSRLSVHPVTGMRNDKVRRDVDTRASKGRKMRYDVHEKLQNFMAPEDRGVWTNRAREEFFASLLGKTASGLLGEDEDEEGSVADSEEDREEGVLKLFRS